VNSTHVIIGIEDKQPIALRFAAESAKSAGVGLRVVHCAEPPTNWANPSLDDILSLGSSQGVLDAAKDILDRAMPEVSADYVLTTGSPYDVLRAESDRASMVVVGTDAEAWTRRVVDGHVAERLAKHSTAPVAIVPERSVPHEANGAVFVAIDARTSATGAMRFAFDQASRRGTTLHVVLFAPPGLISRATWPLRGVISEVADAAISEILAGYSEQFPDVSVTRHLVFDEADKGCLRASDETELLVLGRSSTPDIPLLFGHPVLTQVARRAHCPCVVVPDEWAQAGRHAG
jgi:nucleotide-binding universal stress UspA family protein